jgi:lysophospholipase L1-like esterase
MAKARAENPEVTLVHVTVPLVTVQSGLKARVKKLLGREPDHYGDNRARERFNELMRREYASREPLFDLAAIESTRPDGSRETFEFGGVTSASLVPTYTTDGAHLNPDGRRRVAEQFVAFLADVAGGR